MFSLLFRQGLIFFSRYVSGEERNTNDGVGVQSSVVVHNTASTVENSRESFLPRLQKSLSPPDVHDLIAITLDSDDDEPIIIADYTIVADSDQTVLSYEDNDPVIIHPLTETNSFTSNRAICRTRSRPTSQAAMVSNARPAPTTLLRFGLFSMLFEFDTLAIIRRVGLVLIRRMKELRRLYNMQNVNLLMLRNVKI